MRVRLVLPDPYIPKPLYPGHAPLTPSQHAKIHGEHYAYHNQVGEIYAGIPPDACYVMFGSTYVGCKLEWLQVIED